MRARLLVTLAAAGLVLAGCPLPQALPEYSAGTVTPPQILADAVPYAQQPIVLVPAGCSTTAQPSITLYASILDSTTIESVEARWFVNYDYAASPWSDIAHSAVIPPNPDGTNLTRPVPAWEFRPYDYPPAHATPPVAGPPYPQADVVRVVELVVSNGFDPSMKLESAGHVQGVNRAAKGTFATQVYRWVFVTSSAVSCP